MPTPYHAHPARTILNLGVAFALVLLTACGNPPSTSPPPGGSGPVTATIDRDGGALEATTDDGTRLRITLPPNATAEPLDITITPLEAGTSVARFDLQPFGLRLRLPAEFHLTLPDSAPAGATLFFTTNGTRIPTDTRTESDGRTLVVRTHQLGYPNTAVGSSQLRPRDAAGDTGQVEVDPIACADAILALNRARKPDRDGWLFTVTEAEALLDARLVVLAACTTADDLDAAEAEIELLQEAACARYRDVRTDALTLYAPALGADIDDLWPYAEALVAHAASVAFTGAECANPPDLVADFDELVDRYADAYPTRLQGLDADIWRAVWAIELLNIDRLVAAVALFGLPEPTQTRMRGLAGDLLDALHPHAVERCRDDFSQGYLADLLNGGGHVGMSVWPIPDTFRGAISADDIRGDLQRCADTVTVTAFDELAEPIASQTRTLGATTPGDRPTTTAALTIPSGGALQFGGRLRALSCAVFRQTPQLGDDEIALYVGTSEIARWNHASGNHLAPTRDLGLSEILEAAGLPDTYVGHIELELHREGSACDGTYGDPSTLLYVVDVTVEPTGPTVQVQSGSCGVAAEVWFMQTGNDTAFNAFEGKGTTLEASPDGDGRDYLFVDTVSAEGTATILDDGGSEVGEASGAAATSARCEVFRDEAQGVMSGTYVATTEGEASRDATSFGQLHMRTETGFKIVLELPYGATYRLNGSVGPTFDVRLGNEPDGVRLRPTTGGPRALDAFGTLPAGIHVLEAKAAQRLTNESGSVSDAIDLAFTIETPTSVSAAGR